MSKIKDFDKLVSTKVYKKCVDAGFTKYSEIAILLDTTDSFTKAIFSSNRKKLNLYHLLKLSYELNCKLDDFIPNIDDYRSIYQNEKEEYLCFLKSIEEE